MSVQRQLTLLSRSLFGEVLFESSGRYAEQWPRRQSSVAAVLAMWLKVDLLALCAVGTVLVSCVAPVPVRAGSSWTCELLLDPWLQPSELRACLP